MKANELQTGDLCRVNKSGICIKEDTIVRVLAIDSTNKLEYRGKSLIGGATCEDIADRSNIGGVWCEYLAPIPLTAEKLEEIGFEPRDGHFILSDDYYDIDIWEYSDGIWNARFDCCEMNMPSEQWTISYLHELQQFLRHNQINKDIEPWK